jgi:methyltransferase (TIGR00027 family)
MNSLDKQASGTALATAFVRAFAANNPIEELRCQDHLAEIFLEERQKKTLKDPAIRSWVMHDKLTPGAYEFMIARTAFFDTIVQRALKENIDQVVLLGAGYDSRPYRFAEYIRDTRIFELDAKLTQQRKLECLQRAAITIPAQIHFIPVDFTVDDLKVVLVAASFNPEKQTVYIWEGVTYYLSAEVVDNMLAFVRCNSPPGSSIAFDYAALSEVVLEEARTKEFRKLMKSQYSGEPVRFGLRAGTIEDFLATRGFAIREHLSAAEMQARYLSIGSLTDAGQVPSIFCLVQAMVI